MSEFAKETRKHEHTIFNATVDFYLTAEQRKELAKLLGKKDIYPSSDELEHGVILSFDDDTEYFVFDSEDSARQQAKQFMQDLFDDIGITAWNEDFIESIVPSEIVDFVRPAYEAVRNNNDYSLSRAGAWEKYLDEIFEESIKADGLGNTLSAYDGEEITVDDYHIYRWN